MDKKDIPLNATISFCLASFILGFSIAILFI